MSAPRTADLHTPLYTDPRPASFVQRRHRRASVRPGFIAALGLLALLIGLFGCATFRGQNVETRWFEAKTLYANVLEVAVAYAESPGANPDAVRVLAEANRQARAFVTQGDLLLAAPSSPDRDDALDTTARLLLQITETLRAYLVRIAGEAP